MKKTKKATCPCAEVDFSLQWITESYMELTYCPFCGVEIEDSNEEFKLEDDDSTDED